MKDGEYLLDKNKIIVVDENDAYAVPVGEMEGIIKQKPNRRIFKVKFHLWVYNLVRPEKLQQKKERRDRILARKNKARFEKDSLKNEKRIQNGKDSVSIREPKTSPGFALGWRKWVTETVGEAPVLLDSQKTTSTIQQMNLFLIRKGYFNNEVTDSISFHKRKPKATVYYLVKSRTPYRIRNIQYNITDPSLMRTVNAANKQDSLLIQGNVFDIDVLDDERDRLTTFLLDRGYYGFSKEYIYYQVDSAVGSRQVDITLGVANLKSNVKIDGELVVVESYHQRYYINNIYVFTDYDPRDLKDDIGSYKEFRLNERSYLYREKLPVKPEILESTIYINRGLTYRAKEVEATQKQLSALGVFKSINVRFKVNEEDESGTMLDVYIILIPSPSQFVQLESDATHTGGNYGLQGSFNYTHKNVFRGAEKFKFRMSGGLEIQQLVVNKDKTLTDGGVVGKINPFNTLELGPEISLEVPKIVWMPRRWFKKWISQNSTVKARINYQKRPDFARALQDVSFILNGKPSAQLSHQLRLIEVSALELDPEPEFEATLAAINDAVLRAAFQDHIIAGSQYTFTYNDQSVKKQMSNFYYRASVKGAGNLLRGIYSMTDADADSLGSYRLFGIRFAQMVKTSHEFRWYLNYNDRSQMVYRIFAGAGVPLNNLRESLPFEESFFAGGSNGVRGWRVRSLGPGGYLDTNFTNTLDRIGDIQLEGNLEYRFDLIDVVEGALFVDAGNIWMMRKGNREHAEISTEFWKQIAVSGGIGFRIDLDFFIIRLDAAVQLRDPALPEGERWIFQDKNKINAIRKRAEERTTGMELGNYRPGLNFNFGLGYPF